MARVLVTGAAGFVGRHLVRSLLARGDEVHAVDCLAPGTGAIDPDAGWPLFEPRDHRQFHFHREDCRAWFERSRPAEFDRAFHLAAIVGGRAMIETNPLALADDLSIDAAFWRWAAAARPGKCVLFSSSAAYPVALQRRERHVLLREDMISFEGELGMPDLAYGWAKLTAEYLGRLAYERHGVKSVCYRPFSGYGEDQDGAYPVPAICRRALMKKGAAVLEVWGSGEQRRDFIHIDDCIEGVLGTMDRIDDADALNLSTGIPTSLADLARMAAGIVGYAPEVRGSPEKPSGVHSRAGDTARQRKFGFTPKIDLRTGLARVLAALSLTA